MHSRKTQRKGPVPRFKMGRVCKKFGCKQRLSIYNSEAYCNVHVKEFLS